MTLPGTDGPEVAEVLRPTDHLIFHAQALFAIMINKEAGGAITACGIRMPIPAINRL
jgi:hypothetical protein